MCDGLDVKIEKINFANGLNLPINKSNNQKVNKKNNEKEITELSNVYYKPLSFGRTWKEHKSWGAYVNPVTKEVSFKIFTYPDAERVTVTVENEQDSVKEFELKNKGEGIFEKENIPKTDVKNGDKYYYTIYRPNQDPIKVKDPYSFRQEQLLDKSTIYDHSLYKWNDSNWGKNPNRISRLADKKNNLMPLSKAKIYEFNTVSFTNEGTFESTKQKLKDIKEMGFNAIEIMPVENTYSFNWGYDGVDKFAPSEHLGGPDKLKDLIDTAHQTGLNVIMDMVPNHLGPDGAQLGKTGPYLSHPNDFGDAFNFEGENSKYVRDYIVNSALNWIDNYHCDGLRLDMTKYMESDYTMKQIAAEVNYHKPDAFLIAEDSRSDFRVTKPLIDEEYGKNQNEEIHAELIENISNKDTSLHNLGFDSEWDFDYFHSLKELMYENIDFDNFENICLNSANKVKYTMSHDEIGNFDGTRLISKLMVPILDLNNNVELNDEDKTRAQNLSEHKNQNYNYSLDIVRYQKAQLVSEKLAKMLQTGKLDKYSNDNQNFEAEVLIPLGIKYNSNIDYNLIKNAYDIAFEKNKTGQVITYALPGPKMVFQGDEKADLTPFRFFRQFNSIEDEQYLYWEKGYKHGKAALAESKMDNINYSEKGKKNCNDFANLTKDLNELCKNNSAMQQGQIINENTVKHYVSKVMGFNTKDFDNGNELFTVFNMSNNCHSKNGDKYYINFPEGKWIELLNTNDKKYGGNGKFLNNEILIRDNDGKCPINLNAYSAIIFKKVD